MATKKSAKKKKHPKMDRLLVSKQKHEIKAVAKKTKKSQKAVRAAKAEVGRSRKKIIQKLKSE